MKNTPISTNCITEICDNLLTYENDEVMSNFFFFFASDFYKYVCSSLVHKVKTTTIHLKTFKGSQGHCYLAGNFKSQKKLPSWYVSFIILIHNLRQL